MGCAAAGQGGQTHSAPRGLLPSLIYFDNLGGGLGAEGGMGAGPVLCPRRATTRCKENNIFGPENNNNIKDRKPLVLE